MSPLGSHCAVTEACLNHTLPTRAFTSSVCGGVGASVSVGSGAQGQPYVILWS